MLLWAVVITLDHEVLRNRFMERAYHFHGALNKIFYRANSLMGIDIHDRNGIKPLTIAVLDGNTHHTRIRLAVCSTIGHQFLTHILNVLRVGDVIRLGSVNATISDIDVNDPEWAGLCSLADLAYDAHYPKLNLRFVTPTGIRKKRNGRPFIDRRLTAESVIRSVARRWENLGGDPLPNGLNEYLVDQSKVSENTVLRWVKPFVQNRLKVHAAIGDMCIQCIDPNPVYVHALNVLVRFARFSGVGYHTTQGMGLVATSLEGVPVCD